MSLLSQKSLSPRNLSKGAFASGFPAKIKKKLGMRYQKNIKATQSGHGSGYMKYTVCVEGLVPPVILPVL